MLYRHTKRFGKQYILTHSFNSPVFHQWEKSFPGLGIPHFSLQWRFTAQEQAVWSTAPNGNASVYLTFGNDNGNARAYTTAVKVEQATVQK